MAEADDGARDGGIVGIVQGVADKGLVDLEPVDRKLAQVGERGIASPEIVNGEFDAERMEMLQRLDCVRDVIHEHAFSYFEFQVMRF